METSLHIRRPGEPRFVPEPAAPLGHCLCCHRGVFLAVVKDNSGEPQGYCFKCSAPPAPEPSNVSDIMLHRVRGATDRIGRGTRV